MNGPFGLEEMCRRHRKKKKIEPNAPPKATRKSSIALKTLSSLKSSPAATEPMPRKTRLAPAWRTIWRTLRTFFVVLGSIRKSGGIGTVDLTFGSPMARHVISLLLLASGKDGKRETQQSRPFVACSPYLMKRRLNRKRPVEAPVSSVWPGSSCWAVMHGARRTLFSLPK